MSENSMVEFIEGDTFRLSIPGPFRSGIHVLINGECHSMLFHPTWKLDYLIGGDA